ncbi:hypothetical protein GGF32_002236 [Allomyces javanicus]|nr:hypothetical protein GGF32_002236 [Allomyces javanicus]
MPVQKSSYNLRQKAADAASPYTTDKAKAKSSTPSSPSKASSSAPKSPTKASAAPASPSKASKAAAAPKTPTKIATSASPTRASPSNSPTRQAAKLKLLEELQASKTEWSQAKLQVTTEVAKLDAAAKQRVLHLHVSPTVKYAPTVLGSPIKSAPSSPTKAKAATPPSPTKIPAVGGGVGKATTPKKLDEAAIKKAVGSASSKSPAKH